MQSRNIRYFALLLAVVIGLSVCSIETDAQRRRKRRVRHSPRPVITNPAIAAPGTEPDGDSERIISTADENTTEPQEGGTKRKIAKPLDPGMQQTIDNLSNQVNRLNDKLSQMQENERSLIDMERLTRAEQRAESVRSQIFDTETKLADLEARREEVDYALKPENIERSTAGYGTTHPEDARDARRRQLEGEKARLQTQISLLENSRTRLQGALATAENEVDLLRGRLEQQQQNSVIATPTPTPQP